MRAVHDGIPIPNSSCSTFNRHYLRTEGVQAFCLFFPLQGPIVDKLPIAHRARDAILTCSVHSFLTAYLLIHPTENRSVFKENEFYQPPRENTKQKCQDAQIDINQIL